MNGLLVKSSFFLAFAVFVALGVSAWTGADYPIWRERFDPQAKTGWTLQYFGDSCFARTCGVKSVPTAAFRLDFGRTGDGGCVWPQTNYDPKKGPVFSRGRLSCALFSRLRVPRAGRYAFRVAHGPDDTCVWRVQVNGCDLAERPDCSLHLPAGTADIALYGRQMKDLDRKWPFAAGIPEWRLPDGTRFEPIPDAALAPAADDAARTAVPIAHPFAFKDGRIDWHAYRSWDFSVPTAGVYRITVHAGGPCQHERVRLDGREIYFWQGRSDIDWNGGVSDEVDTSGRTDIFRCDFYGRRTFVRRFARGRHTLDLFVNPGPWFWDDRMPELMTQGTLRVGWEPVSGSNPASARGFYFADRDDLVCAQGDVLALTAVNAGGCGLVVDGTRVKGWRLPTDRPGVHRFHVTDAEGRIVFGPWEYPVVAAAEKDPGVKTYRSECVDSVDCTRTDHDFRDNGTSVVTTDADGRRSRRLGPGGLSWVSYDFVDIHHREKGMRPSAKGAKGQTRTQAHDWFAYTLKVRRPGVPHIVRFTCPNGRGKVVNSLYAIDPKTGQYNGWNLMTGMGSASGAESACGFVVWPNADRIDVMAVNSDGNHNSSLDRRGSFRKIELVEYPDGLPPLEVPACGWRDGRDFGWEGEQVDLGVNERTMPDLLAGNEMVPATGGSHVFRDWKAFLASWDRFGEFSAWRGDNLVFQPVNTYGMRLYGGTAGLLTYPDADVYIRGSRNRYVDLFDRDVFKLMLLEAGRRGVRLVADCMIQRITPETAAEWARSYGCPTNGVLLSERADGEAFKSFSGSYFPNPAHPAVIRRMTAFCEALGERYGTYPAFAGIRHRFWRGWPASFEPTFYRGTLGFDDFTTGLFARETGIALPSDFEARRKDLTTRLAREWDDWRAAKVLALHEKMLAALRKHAPQARFYAQNAGEGDGSANIWVREAGLDPKVFRGRRELGYLEEQAYVIGPDVEINHLDPMCFAAFNRRGGKYANPVVTNGVYFPLTYPQGLCCNRTYAAAPYHLRPAAEALADNRLKQLLAGGQWCLPPADESLRRFVRTYRAIPDTTYEPAEPDATNGAPVAVWCHSSRNGILFYAVNRTDRRRKTTIGFGKEASVVVDPVSGARRANVREVTIELPAYEGAVRAARGVDRISRVVTPVEADERADLVRECAFVESFPEVRKGEVGAEAADVIRAMRQARAAGDDRALRRAVSVFRRDHALWYETHAWPAWRNVYRSVWRNTVSSFHGDRRCEYQILDETNGVPNVAFEGFKEKFFTVRKDVPVRFRLSGCVGGWRTLTITALFGGGYGAVDVLDEKGRLVGTFPSGTTETPRLETRTLKVPLACTENFIAFTLVPRGEKGLALNRIAKDFFATHPIEVWKKTAEGRETWVWSPCTTGTTLFVRDGFRGTVCVNDRQVGPEWFGNAERFMQAGYVRLDKGWNRIAAKVGPVSDGTCRFGAYLLDCRGFRYAETGPSEQQERK